MNPAFIVGSKGVFYFLGRAQIKTRENRSIIKSIAIRLRLTGLFKAVQLRLQILVEMNRCLFITPKRKMDIAEPDHSFLNRARSEAALYDTMIFDEDCVSLRFFQIGHCVAGTGRL